MQKVNLISIILVYMSNSIWVSLVSPSYLGGFKGSSSFFEKEQTQQHTTDTIPKKTSSAIEEETGVGDAGAVEFVRLAGAAVRGSLQNGHHSKKTKGLSKGVRRLSFLSSSSTPLLADFSQDGQKKNGLKKGLVLVTLL